MEKAFHQLGERFLAPIVAAFLEAYPAVDVVVHLSDRPVDLVAERFDIALRAGELADSSLVSKLVGTSTYRIVASPAYLLRHGTPLRPADLSAHACVRFAKGGEAVRTTWPLRLGKRVVEVPVQGRLVSDDFVVLRTAAERGVGIARLPDSIVQRALRAGRLVSMLDAHAPPPTPVHLLHVAAPRLPSRTQAFIAFAYPRLVAAIGETAAV